MQQRGGSGCGASGGAETTEPALVVAGVAAEVGQAAGPDLVVEETEEAVGGESDHGAVEDGAQGEGLAPDQGGCGLAGDILDVIDSSVLIAAIARPGVCTELLDEVARDHTLVLSDFILREADRKLREKFDVPAKEAARLAKAMGLRTELVTPEAVQEGECRDPNDLPIPGTAKAARAELLVTVEKDLLALGHLERTAIIRPGEFWRRALRCS